MVAPGVVMELGSGHAVRGAVVRGYPGAGAAGTPGAATLLRDAASDMFSLGTAEARAAGLRDAATLGDALPGGPVQPAAVERAVATVAGALAAGTAVVPAEVVPDGAAGALRCTPPAGAGPAEWMRLGADVHRLRAALAAEGVASTVLPEAGGLLVALTGR